MIHDVDEDRKGLKASSWTFNSNVGDSASQNQESDGLRVFHLPEEWMYVRTEVIPCPTLIISLSRQCGTLFLWVKALLKQAMAPSATSREGDSAFESCPYRARNDTSWSNLLSKHELGWPRKAIIITAALFVKSLNHSNVIRVFLILINTYVQNFANLFLYRCHPFCFQTWILLCPQMRENLSGSRYYATNAMLSDMPIKINSSTEGT